MKHFQKQWPIDEMLKQYLSNTHRRKQCQPRRAAKRGAVDGFVVEGNVVILELTTLFRNEIRIFYFTDLSNTQSKTEANIETTDNTAHLQTSFEPSMQEPNCIFFPFFSQARNYSLISSPDAADEEMMDLDTDSLGNGSHLHRTSNDRFLGNGWLISMGNTWNHNSEGSQVRPRSTIVSHC
jgi:hypothetical protein